MVALTASAARRDPCGFVEVKMRSFTSFVADHGRECHLLFEFRGLKKLNCVNLERLKDEFCFTTFFLLEFCWDIFGERDLFLYG